MESKNIEFMDLSLGRDISKRGEVIFYVDTEVESLQRQVIKLTDEQHTELLEKVAEIIEKCKKKAIII
jgi:CII-binding regulator of phage lambda lysogenization HflD